MPTRPYASRRTPFVTVRTEGGLLPAELLERISAGNSGIPGLTPDSYHLPPRERLGEAANRSWNTLLAAWGAFRRASDALGPGEPGTGVTRERWLLPLFAELGYGRLPPARPVEVEGKAYPVSHGYHLSPIHLVGRGVDIDRRTPGVAGAARSSPYSLVQELLNRSQGPDKRLWGFVSNGLRLRLLRDNESLTRQAYVEFDLQAMMDGEVYADFVALWLLCHQSRVEAARPADCWLEEWSRLGREQGVRLHSDLRRGVEAAIAALGSGFLAHPANAALRERLYSGALHAQDYYRQLLRLVYRLLFLFVAEDRGLLLDPHAPPEARDRYTRYYATARLRHLAGRRIGAAHHDLYQGLRLVMDKLGSDGGCPELGLPALGSFLFSEAAMPDLRGRDIGNGGLLAAVRALAYTVSGRIRLPVDYRNLGAEELGGVYESLLELHPVLNADAAAFTLKTAGGNDRKRSGSYYTPASLINSLLDSALEPVLDEAARDRRDPETAILRLKVCDLACGSGHFLIAAANRLAKRLAAVRSGDEEPAPEAVRAALRDVIGRCIYGVDVNPMSVELCRVSLWLEALEPGKPLNFLDAHIQCGNSLLGATPRLLDGGIPNAAFEPIEGDDRAYCKAFRKVNDGERKGKQTLPDPDAPWERLGDLAAAMAGLEALGDDRIADVHRKEERYAALVRSSDYRFGRLRADAWCAAFVWRKAKAPPPGSAAPRSAAPGSAGFQPAPVPTGATSDPLAPPPPGSAGFQPAPAPAHSPEPVGFDYPITDAVYRRIERNPYDVAPWMREEIERLAGAGADADADSRHYNFLHWHLAFPDVFRVPPPGERPENEATGWSGGFDVVLGNPPWERIKLQEKEWFEDHGRPDIANAANAAHRQRMIAALHERGNPDLSAPASYNPALYAAFLADRRRSEGESHLVRDSGRYPLTAVGDVNTYAIFAEAFRSLLSKRGRAGLICPTGIATDDSTKAFFGDLVTRQSLASLYDFENRKAIFPGVHRSYKFCLLTMSGAAIKQADFAFFCTDTADLTAPNRRFALTPDDIALLNPNTKTCPIFRTARDAGLTKAIYRRVPVLVDETSGANPWGISFLAMLHMSNDSKLFQDAPAPDLVPLYEAKLLHQFDHRWATYNGGDTRDLSDAEKADPACTVTPRYWVPRAEVQKRLRDKGWDYGWLLGWRDICRGTDQRTLISSLFPRVGSGDTFLLAFPKAGNAALTGALLANFNSFVLDYATRQKIGGTHLKYHVFKQIPVLPPATYVGPTGWTNGLSLEQWIAERVLELVYTAWDMAPFARDLGHDGAPFHWDPARRFLLRCELDAAYFHLYGIARDDAAYIMDTFPIVRRDDEARHGHYRTRDRILSVYDAMAIASRDGRPYATVLDPAP